MARDGWRVFSKFRAFLLWFGGFHLGASVVLIFWGIQDGRTALNMMSPILNCVVAVMFVLMATRMSPTVEDVGVVSAE